AADVDVGGLDLAPGETDRGEQVEVRRRQSLGADTELVADEVLAKSPLVEGELDVEGGRQRFLHLGDRLIREAFGLQGRGVDAWRVGQRAVADGVGLDLRDLALA